MIETGLPVTQWVQEWRDAGEPYTSEAILHVAHIKIKDKLSERRSDGSNRFRPSMIGNTCARAQVFSYLGLEQAPGREEWEQMAHTGSELHYAWQEQGLSAGWLSEVEVEIDIPKWRLRGQADGLCKDRSIFELKTIGSDKFWGKRNNLPVFKWEHPVAEHVRQVTAYMHALDTEQASIVYVDRDSNAFREFRVTFDAGLFEAMDEMVGMMIGHVDEGTLPPILPGCAEAMSELASHDPFSGSQPRLKSVGARKFNFCNYREVCGGQS